MSKQEVKRMHKAQIERLAAPYLDAKRDMRKAGLL
jgi:hypothetical protein